MRTQLWLILEKNTQATRRRDTRVTAAQKFDAFLCVSAPDMRTDKHTGARQDTHTQTYTHPHTHAHAHAHAHIHTHTDAHTHMHAHAHIHTHTRAHRRTQTHTLAHKPEGSRLLGAGARDQASRDPKAQAARCMQAARIAGEKQRRCTRPRTLQLQAPARGVSCGLSSGCGHLCD
jgi:hypothetical protein